MGFFHLGQHPSRSGSCAGPRRGHAAIVDAGSVLQLERVWCAGIGFNGPPSVRALMACAYVRNGVAMRCCRWYLHRVRTSGRHGLGAIAPVVGRGGERHRVGRDWMFECDEGKGGGRADPLERDMNQPTASDEYERSSRGWRW